MTGIAGGDDPVERAALGRRPLAIVADDNEVTRELYALWLRSDGYEVVEAANGDEAVLAILEHRPDLVVCDVNMPGRSGPEVTRWIRQTPAVAALPVVQVSAQMDAEFLEGQRLGEGADAYLAMPVPRERFLATIRSLSSGETRPVHDSGAPAMEGATDPGMDQPVRRRIPLGLKIGALIGSFFVGITLVGLAGWAGVRSVAASNEDLYEHEFRAALLLNNLNIHFVEAKALAFALISTDDPARQTELFANLNNDLIPHIEADLARLQSVAAADPDLLEESDVESLRGEWRDFTAFLSSPDVRLLGGEQRKDASNALIARAEEQFKGVSVSAEALVQRANEVAADDYAAGRREATASSRRLALTGLITMLITAALSLRLHRDVVGRTKQYSTFAAAVASGTASAQVTPRGRDEITELGHALNRLVEQQSQARQAHERRVTFSNALQLVADEDEAHSLLHRYIERLVPESAAFVLTRNNSADRLEVRTPLPQPSALGDRVARATPQSCRAIRTGRVHDEQVADDSLMNCALCRGVSGASTCVPLLVGGEVIGSVLTCARELPDDRAKEAITATVAEAAPVIANLRNIAVAEHRAAVDTLTGLATRRAVQEALPRLVAQASRAGEPVAALMLDLDHFKNVNDTYGHEVGDHVLGAVGTAISGSIRAADLAGRFGGEEFVVFLPGTRLEGAIVAAEKIRAAIARIRIPDGPPEVTASVGVAVLPDDAADAAALLRIADRALYEAKRAGRNRVARATSGDVSTSPEVPAPRD